MLSYWRDGPYSQYQDSKTLLLTHQLKILHCEYNGVMYSGAFFRSGDRFIEEKTLLLAVRSYVFFSQLSAWLSASHGLVPRNILYR